MPRFPERVIFPAKDLIQIGRCGGGGANDGGPGSDVSQPAMVTMQETRDTADEIEERERVDGAHQVADDDLGRFELESAGVDNAQSKQALAHCLSAPQPFAESAVSQCQNKISNN